VVAGVGGLTAVDDSPSIVPDLTEAVSLIKKLADAKREGDADALNKAVPLFESVPALREAVHSMAVGAAHSEALAERSRDRKAKHVRRNVQRARRYQARRADPLFANLSDTDLKALCGERLVPDPFEPKKFLPTLARKQYRQLTRVSH